MKKIYICLNFFNPKSIYFVYILFWLCIFQGLCLLKITFLRNGCPCHAPKKKLLKYIRTIKKVLSTKSRAAFVCASILGIGTFWPFYFTGETTWNNFEIHSLFFFSFFFCSNLAKSDKWWVDNFHREGEAGLGGREGRERKKERDKRVEAPPPPLICFEQKVEQTRKSI